MKGALLIIICFLLLQRVKSQEFPSKHPSILGIHYSLSDFNNNISFGQLNKMNAGLSLIYLKGINNNLDWLVELNGSFPDNVMTHNTIDKKLSYIESSFSIRERLFNLRKFIQPFVQQGIGIFSYNKNAGSLFSIGPGLEVNYKDVYITLNTQYKFSLNKNINNHLFYSIGISGRISHPKQEKHFTERFYSKTPQRDRDGDGIVDSVDACPDIPGIARFNGCPDSDGDGIPDKDDACPKVFGYEKYHGCPIPDRDGDGINDEEDQCPDVPGVLKYHGCPIPDTDGDGVNDEQDSCITVPGGKENHGCPIIKMDIINELNFSAKNIYFKTGSYILLPISNKSLDEVAEILRQNSSIKLMIEGHTDNIGKDSSNQSLSKKRANTVVNYLISKGIDSARLKAIGYGAQRPIVENTTSEGRALNRRVIFHIFQ
jgi:OOP family OmpA-OmpF porin